MEAPSAIETGGVLKKIQVLNWLLTAAMGLAAWLIFSENIGRAIFLGGVIAACSFSWLQRDLSRLFSGPLTMLKGRFFIKYYARLSFLALILFWLISYYRIHVLGMLAGLSVVMLSIAVTAIGEAKRIIFPVKEAL
jgi:hypothetical protein